MYTFLVVALRHPISSSPLHLFTSSFSSPLHFFTSSFSSPLHLFILSILFPSSPLHSLSPLHLFTSASLGLPHLPGAIPELCRASSNDLDIVIEFRGVVTVNTPAVWLARENIKRLTPRPCINVEYSHGVVYMEEEARRALPHIRSTIQYPDHIYTKPL